MTKRKRGHRFDAWVAKYGTALPKHWRLYCRQRRPDLNPDAVWEDFCEIWLAKTGHNSTKLNWRLTWQTWVRRETRRPHNAHSVHVAQVEAFVENRAVEFSNSLNLINNDFRLGVIKTEAERAAAIAALKAKLT